MREGLAESADTGKAANGRGQKVYRITDKGLHALSDWLVEEPEVEKLRYEILLKISFGKHTRPEVLIKHLDDFIRRNETALAEITSIMEIMSKNPALPESDHSYSRLTALCGKYHYAAMRDWALEARESILKEVETK